MTARELALWLNEHGWTARVADDETVVANRADRRYPRHYLRVLTMFGHYWRIVNQKGT